MTPPDNALPCTGQPSRKEFLRSMSRKTRIQTAFYAAMLLLAGCFFAMLLRAPLGNQAGIFYMKSERLFEDYVRVAEYSANRNPYFEDTNGYAEHAYPPFVYCLFFILSKLADYRALGSYGAGHTLLSLTEIGLIATLCALWLFGLLYELNRNGKLHKVLLTLVLFGSGIYLSAYERGNVILLAVIATTAYLMLYDHENKILREIGFIALAVAAAIKCFPAVFGLLLVYEKRWKDAVRLMLYGVLCFFVPFLFLQGGLANIPQWLSNLQVFGQAYHYSTAFGWQGLMRYVPEAAQGITALVCNVATLLLMGGGVVASFWQPSAWKQITFLACIQILFPSVSHLYCGLYLLPCVVLFFNDALTEKRNWVYAALFVVVFQPIQWVTASGVNFTYTVVNCAVIALFLLLCGENAAAAWRALHTRKVNAKKAATDSLSE